MEFTEKSVDEVGEWLKLEKFSRTPCKYSRVYTTSVIARYTIYLKLEEYLRLKNKIGWFVFKF